MPPHAEGPRATGTVSEGIAAADAGASQVRHPIETPPGLPPLPADAAADAYVQQRLIDLLGRPAVLSLVNATQFVPHFVATVDNLPRETASSRLWPVVPAPERFLVDQAGEQTVLGEKNAARYTPLVELFELMDTHSAMALYRHLYPLFQRAYEDLGYPGRYFNDRLVEVIDHLLQAPEPIGPVALSLTEVKGPVPSTRPWLRYEFADPDLQARSAGQKILVRMGPVHERRVKARLKEFRALLVQATPSTH